jgi:predicted ATPase
MKLSMKNVGKIHKEVELKIDGITVLAGENGTGKSTIGKTLYCIYDTLYNYDEKIFYNRANSIMRKARMMNRAMTRNTMQQTREFIFSFLEKGQFEDSDIVKLITNVTKLKDNQVDVEDVSEIKLKLEASEDEILVNILKRDIESEFRNQLAHVNYANEDSEIRLDIRGEVIDVTMNKEKVFINDKVKLVKDIIYIDDPNVMDELYDMSFSLTDTHRTRLAEKIRGENNKDFSAVDGAIIDKKLELVFNKLQNICGGGFTEKEDDYTYKDDKLKSSISITNMSTGMKSFMILKVLLKKGYLEENGIVVLDEPETHLHPGWMKVYAEIVVLLNMILGINFVISTHSSEFLSYIELYSKIHKIDDKCNYYMLLQDEFDSTSSVIKDYTNDIDRIYDVLSRPFLQASKELDRLNEGL